MNGRPGPPGNVRPRRLAVALWKILGTLRGATAGLVVARRLYLEAVVPSTGAVPEGETDGWPPFGHADLAVQTGDLGRSVNGSINRTLRGTDRLAAANVDGPIVDHRSLLSFGGRP